jgi:hypothetical protein
MEAQAQTIVDGSYMVAAACRTTDDMRHEKWRISIIRTRRVMCWRALRDTKPSRLAGLCDITPPWDLFSVSGLCLPSPYARLYVAGIDN